MRGGWDAELGDGAFVPFADADGVCSASVGRETGLNAERIDGDGAVSSGGVPGIGTASRTVGVPGVGVVPTVGAAAFGATRRGETGVGPACVGGTAFVGTCSFAIVCDASFKTFDGETARDAPFKTFDGETARDAPFKTFDGETARGVSVKTFDDETARDAPFKTFDDETARGVSVKTFDDETARGVPLVGC